jgi:hypothetical protein
MISAILAGLKVVPWRAIGAGALVVAAVFSAWRITVWRDSHVRALPEARQALEAEQACSAGSECALRVAALTARQEEFNRQVATGYAQQLEEISSRPPAPAVRLCRPARQGGVPGAGAASPADGSTGSGDVPVEVGADIGRQLYELADEADRETLKLRWLQEWNRGMAAPHINQD